jgi:2-polyprenyl-3-methyl-5-hydroxy-6-metoxy-1,4-benzoquinol methylase
MMWARHLEREWLDDLPSDDSAAQKSRRDLRRLNYLMLHAGILLRILRTALALTTIHSIIDIGGGDGTFMLTLARRIARRTPGVAVTVVDRRSSLSQETYRGFKALGWTIDLVEADVLEFLAQSTPGRANVIIANLFLHHLREDELRKLFGLAMHVAPLFVACEPHRGWFPLAASRLLWAIGCNKVTQHDAPASVRAGFRDRELSMIWPQHHQWLLQEGRAGPFSHFFVARHAD